MVDVRGEEGKKPRQGMIRMSTPWLVRSSLLAKGSRRLTAEPQLTS